MHWPEEGWMILAHWLASGPDLFSQNLTHSARTESDPGWFLTISSGTSTGGSLQPSLKGKTGSGPVVSCQKPGLMIPAHRLAYRPDAFHQTLTRPTRSDLGWFCTVRSMPSLVKRNWIGHGKLDQAYMIRPSSGFHAGCNGHNWP